MTATELLENLQNLPLEERAKRIHGFRHDTLGLKLGIEVTLVSLERMEATMPIQGNVQPFGRLHGGTNVVLAEELASIGSVLNLDLRRELAVGVDINATMFAGLHWTQVKLKYAAWLPWCIEGARAWCGTSKFSINKPS